MVAEETTPLAGPGTLAGLVVLAGGTGERLGGVSKADYVVSGSRLLDILLDEVRATGFTGKTVVVGPPKLTVPPGVVLTLEDPPLGGPLAGVGAGVAALSELPEKSWVVLAACDAPLSPRLWGQLLRLIKMHQEPGLDGGIPLKERHQYLQGIYRLSSLRGLDFSRNSSLRRSFAGLNLANMPDSRGFTADVDTPAGALTLASRLAAPF